MTVSHRVRHPLLKETIAAARHDYETTPIGMKRLAGKYDCSSKSLIYWRRKQRWVKYCPPPPLLGRATERALEEAIALEARAAQQEGLVPGSGAAHPGGKRRGKRGEKHAGGGKRTGRRPLRAALSLPGRLCAGSCQSCLEVAR